MAIMSPDAVPPAGPTDAFPSSGTSTSFPAWTPKVPTTTPLSIATDGDRRRSLPPLLSPILYDSNVSIVVREEAVRGKHTLDEATIAHRISALKQLNAATSSRMTHRYAKSTGARSSTYSQPVIVRTYSEDGNGNMHRAREDVRSRPKSVLKKPAKKPAPTDGKLELPPLSEFTFKGIMDSIHTTVADDLERIAEICARSRYSLSNQYEVHMPPHGEGDGYLVKTPGHRHSHRAGSGMAYIDEKVQGPTLQAIASNDEDSVSRNSDRRRLRRQKSKAVGTLETIYSSSKSSEEEKIKKQGAQELAEQVKERARKRNAGNSSGKSHDEAEVRCRRHLKADTFTSLIINKTATTDKAPVARCKLVGKVAKAQTSTAIGVQAAALPANTPDPEQNPKLVRNDSRASTLQSVSAPQTKALLDWSSWLPWTSKAGAGGSDTRSVSSETLRASSHAEGSLRELLNGVEADRKGKGVDRSGLDLGVGW